jgi:hypothetical protein
MVSWEAEAGWHYDSAKLRVDGAGVSRIEPSGPVKAYRHVMYVNQMESQRTNAPVVGLTARRPEVLIIS